LGDRDQGGVEHRAGGGAGPLAREQQVEVVAEVDLADQVLREVGPAHDDLVLVGGADGGARRGGLADFQVVLPRKFGWVGWGLRSLLVPKAPQQWTPTPPTAPAGSRTSPCSKACSSPARPAPCPAGAGENRRPGCCARRTRRPNRGRGCP